MFATTHSGPSCLLLGAVWALALLFTPAASPHMSAADAFARIGSGYCRAASPESDGQESDKKKAFFRGAQVHTAACETLASCKARCKKDSKCKGIAFSPIDKMGHCGNAGKASNKSRCIVYSGTREIVTTIMIAQLNGNDDYDCYRYA